MSKKIAEGTHALVVDVKVGRGAFIKSIAQARELATTMVRLGSAHGVATTAQLTSMNAPLGRNVGNALEVRESIDVLQGRGPSDVRALTLALARIMVELVGIDVDPETKLDDGSGFEVYQRMIRAQGGDPDATLPVAAYRDDVVSNEDGVVQSIDALDVGIAAWRLGAGRARKEDPVSAAAGVVCLIREGEAITKGQPMFELHADDETHLQQGRDAIADAVVVSEQSVNAEPLLLARITN
jgi:thymidine phosphorylase